MVIFSLYIKMSIADITDTFSILSEVEVLQNRITELEQMLRDEREEYKDIYMRMKKHTDDTATKSNKIFPNTSVENGQAFQIYYLNKEVNRLRLENDELRSKLNV